MKMYAIEINTLINNTVAINSIEQKAIMGKETIQETEKIKCSKEFNFLN